ncbi:MAG: hypothetical protein U0793_05605 [Gemmataceae bacterium]
MSSEQFSAEGPRRRAWCPYCGAEHVSARPQKCWLCQADFGQTPEAAGQDERIDALTERIALPRPREEAEPLAAFGILALLICLGLALVAPGVLIIVSFLAIPAIIRTAVVSEKKVGPLWTFLGSLGTVVVVGTAAFAAFFATCFVVCLGGLALEDLSRGRSYEWIFVASVGAGLVPGILVMVFLFRRLWGKKA